SVVFSPNGNTIASSSKDGTIELWSKQGQLLRTLKGHSSEVLSVVFSVKRGSSKPCDCFISLRYIRNDIV
ncbi:MAG: hypothetical protein HC917_25065, partial [Richelia sp. SM2_1_7]|nr:hypothetical protein [Richelia sp. SM2_1_7]